MEKDQISLYSSIRSLENAIKNTPSSQDSFFDSSGILTGFAILRGILKNNFSGNTCKYTVIMKEHNNCVNSIEQMTREVNRKKILKLKNISEILYRRLKNHIDVISSVDGNTLVGRSFIMCSDRYFSDNASSVLSKIGTDIKTGIYATQNIDIDRISPPYLDEYAVLYNVFSKKII